MVGIKAGDVQIRQLFLNGDIRGAIAYMREHEEFKDILPAYAAIFEDQILRRAQFFYVLRLILM